MAGPLVKKLGKLALTILLLGSFTILLSLSGLIFLWVSPVSNPTWQAIILNNWLTNAVTIFSELLKQALSFQVGLCAAMLSAIALERFVVLLPEVASCLAFRNDYSPWNVVMLFWKAAPRKNHIVGVKSRTILFTTLLLVYVAAITQLISILLVSDIGLGQVSGFPHLSDVAYGFEYNDKVNGTPTNEMKRAIVAIGSWATSSTTPLVSSTSSPASSSSFPALSSSIPASPTSSSQTLSATSLPSTISSSHAKLTTSTSTQTSSSSETLLSSSSVSTSPMTAGSQGWNVSPAGYAPLPDNNQAAAAPLIQGQTAWRQQPFFYPSFAEYHEDPPAYDSDGIDDTGRTLRAFLPYKDANTRNTLQSFSGHTTVLDARVTCQTPKIGNISFAGDPTSSIVFNGTVSSTHATPRLFNATQLVDEDRFNVSKLPPSLVPVPFSCVLPTMHTTRVHATSKGNNSPNSTDWFIALCQLANGASVAGQPSVSGGLVSEFVDMPSLNSQAASDASQSFSRNTGVAYLLFNISAADDSYWHRVYGNTGNANNGSLQGQVYHGQWLDIPYGDASDPVNQIVVSSTLCYAAFDNADLDITMSGSTNRTEPAPKTVANDPNSVLDFSAVAAQLRGDASTTGSTSSPAGRGLLSLAARSSWIANGSREKPPSVSYLRDAANLQGATGRGFEGNLTLALWDPGNTGASSWIQADPNNVYLFQELIRMTDSSGKYSPAHALQGLLTVISSTTYYSQLQQFTASAEATQTFFVTANIPVQAKGLTVVAVTALVHLTVMAFVLIVFLRECRLTMLGCEWQSLLQGIRGEVAELGELETLDGMRDDDVEKVLKDVGKHDLRVGVGRSVIDGRIHLMRPDDSTRDHGKKGSISTLGGVGPVARRVRPWKWLRRKKQRGRTAGHQGVEPDSIIR